MDMATRQKVRGYGSELRPLARDQWAREAYLPGWPALTETGNIEPPPESMNVPYSVYHDKDWAQAEEQQIWAKSWLYACREEDLPELGDRVPFNVGSRSYIIVRTGQDDFKAFYNSCLHRGTKLCSKPETGDTIRCPYHAWEWSVDGSLKRIPSHWDFQDIKPGNASLPEVHLDRWGGFIFINASDEPGPLLDALGPLQRHFQGFFPERRYTAARFRKTVKANWKICQEAFMESYHVYATHPEASPFTGDTQCQYDIWVSGAGHVGRNGSASITPSMLSPADATVFVAGQIFLQAMRDWHYPEEPLPEIVPQGDIRAQIAAWHRDVAGRFYARTFEVPDAVMLDSLLYFIFPHMGLWLSEAVPFAYQFLPHETDPEMSYFEVRLLLPAPGDRPAPPSAPTVELDETQSIFEHCPAFGFLGYVFDQDMSNMPKIQQGAKAANPKAQYSRLGEYQEMLIQHWNQVIADKVRAGTR